jgi:hypothetical protein
MTIQEIQKKYGATYTPITSSPLQAIASKYGATIISPKETGIFEGTKQGFEELLADPLSLKANPTKIISSAWETIKGSVEQEKENISNLFKSKTPFQAVGGTLKAIAGAAGIGYSPISALFEGAKQIPVLGSVSKLIGTAFTAAGEGGGAIGGGIIDQLPIAQEDKDALKPGVEEIFALASQLALGKISSAALKGKKSELAKKYGEKDANTIINEVTRLAEEKRAEKVQKPIEPIKPVEEIKPTEPQPLAQEAKMTSRIGTYNEYAEFNKLGSQNQQVKEMVSPTLWKFKRGDEAWAVSPQLDGVTKIKIKDFGLGDSSIVAEKRGHISANLYPTKELAEQRISADIFNKAKGVEVKPIEVPVEVPKIPEGTGELKTSGLAQTLKEQAIAKGIQDDFGELPQYKARPMKIKEADEFVRSDYETSMKAINGEITPPKDLLVGEVYSAMKRKAIMEGDVKTLMDLTKAGANDIATAFGREVKAFDSMLEADPVRAIRELGKIKNEVATKRTTPKAKSDLLTKSREIVKKSVSKRETWAELVKSLQC